MSDEDLLQIKQQIEKRLKDKTGLDFVAKPVFEYLSFQFSVDLVFRKYAPCNDIVDWNEEDFNQRLERDIDLVLKMLAMDLNKTNKVLRKLWE